jgi:hypothetical protein
MPVGNLAKEGKRIELLPVTEKQNPRAHLLEEKKIFHRLSQ